MEISQQYEMYMYGLQIFEKYIKNIIHDLFYYDTICLGMLHYSGLRNDLYLYNIEDFQ